MHLLHTSFGILVSDDSCYYSELLHRRSLLVDSLTAAARVIKQSHACVVCIVILGSRVEQSARASRTTAASTVSL
jgi:hypothetical protein